MTEAMVMWVLIAIVQAQGPTGGAYGSFSACEEQKGVFLQMQDVVFLSECTPVKMLQKDQVTKK